jgi:hypothetical protein
VTVKGRSRWLVWRLLLAVFSVAVFTGVAWDNNGGNGKYLAIDLAVGVGTTAVIYGCWWLVKRSVQASKRAFRRSYQEALALESHHARRLGRWLGEAQSRASRPERRDAMIRDAAGRAGRIVGSARRAFREGYGQTGHQDR